MLNGRCATAAQAECLLEVWKRTDATPAADGCAEDNGESISSVLNQSNRESRIERSAGVIRARAVNVKWSACDQRAVQCKLIPFVAESVLSHEKALNSVVFTTIWSSEPDCESLISRDCNSSESAIYG
ncbi:hypothetical protein T08_1090 [Trichinella sp. T8]|nr:hypothetical protein T08_1090 [Trichinella sp. T8]